jgi:hypothetical protein
MGGSGVQGQGTHFLALFLQDWFELTFLPPLTIFSPLSQLLSGGPFRAVLSTPDLRVEKTTQPWPWSGPLPLVNCLTSCFL